MYKGVIKNARFSFETFHLEKLSRSSNQDSQGDFWDLGRFFWEREPLLQKDLKRGKKTGSEDNLEKKIEASYRRGFQEGREEGIKIGRSQVIPLLELIQKLIQELKEKREQIIEEAELMVIRLALQITRKIIHQEVSTNPELILYVVRETLKKAVAESKMKVRVNPADLKVLEQNRDVVFPNIEALTFIADDEISRGGCVVETNSGIIDARLEAQLAEIEEALLEEEDAQQV